MNIVKIIGGFLSLLGIIALIATVISIVRTGSFLVNSTKTEGRIIDIVYRSTSKDRITTIYDYPVISFRDDVGKLVEFKSSISCKGVQVGDSIEIRYNPDDSSNARVTNSFLTIWFSSIWFAVFATVLIASGVFTLWLESYSIPTG
ncbi:MAG: DUF3592 domain-containing protein [Halanaerobiales bacterium]